MKHLALTAAALAMLATTAAAQQAPIKIGGTGGSTSGKRPPPIIKAGPSAEDKMLAAPFAITTYEWRVGKGPVAGPSASTHMCLLTRVSGNLAGPSERIALWVDNGAAGGPRWMLNGTSKQAELLGEITCAPRSRMVPTGPVNAVGYTNHMTGSCAPHTVTMPDPTLGRAFFVSGLSGRWRGSGESVAVESKTAKTSIKVTGCSGNADGTLMSVGIRPGKPVLYRTPSDRSPKINASTFVLGMSGDNRTPWYDVGGEPFWYGAKNAESVFMAPVDEAICGIVALSGKFQGYGENAEIGAFKNDDGRIWWRASIGNQADLYAIRMGVRCIARDQR